MRSKPLHPVIRTSIGLAAFLAVGIQSGFGCVNTSYSKVHEKQITGDLVRIVMGQFAEHGDAFYRAELKRTTRILEEKPGDVEGWTDHAVALLKLRRFEEAEKELLKSNEQFPGRYKTHANLGVLYKKMGRFGEAAEQTRQALEIKPGGHLGLGDYYLKMLTWRERNARDENNPPRENFLGVSYDGPVFTTDSNLVNEEFLKTMIIADRHFPDAYVVLGDLKKSQDNLDLAYRCYTQAMRLSQVKEETPKAVIQSRILEIEMIWEEEARRDSTLGFDSDAIEKKLSRQFLQADAWAAIFQQTEAEMIAKGRRPDIETVKKEIPSGIGAEGFAAIGPFERPKKRGFFARLFGFGG